MAEELFGKLTQQTQATEARRKAAKKTSAHHNSDSMPRRRGRPEAEQERVAFTTRVRADVRTKINVAAAEHNVKPSDVIDALVDGYLEDLDWDTVGANRR